MPCTSVFIPMWEIEMGTDSGAIGSRNMFQRKADPIVNGISNMERFKPADKVRTDKPTVVMLSTVQFIKGVKIAILGAWGSKTTSLSSGFGDPKVVLQDAWLLMNSSTSEGLPLAIGEAALAGVPIVATEVGTTASVLTDPNKPEQQYGEVVPPNDSMALVRAQLSMLSMVGPWSKFTADSQEKPPVFPDEVLPEHIEWLTRRFYVKPNDRRQLGSLSREVVLRSFHASRYLRTGANELVSMFGSPKPLQFVDN
ncbi:glycosyl transferase [Fusarium sp. NRRL 25303]|nr:glycosyl transferase [Fusarium sp. NRRL 25303]